MIKLKILDNNKKQKKIVGIFAEEILPIINEETRLVVEFMAAGGGLGMPKAIVVSTISSALSRIEAKGRQDASKGIMKNIVAKQAPALMALATAAMEKRDASWFQRFARRPSLALGEFQLGPVTVGAESIKIDDKVSLSGARMVVDRGVLKGLILKADVGNPKKGGISTRNYFVQTPNMKLAHLNVGGTLSMQALREPTKTGAAEAFITVGALGIDGGIKWNEDGVSRLAANFIADIPVTKKVSATVGAGIAQDFEDGRPIAGQKATKQANVGIKGEF